MLVSLKFVDDITSCNSFSVSLEFSPVSKKVELPECDLLFIERSIQLYRSRDLRELLFYTPNFYLGASSRKKFFIVDSETLRQTLRFLLGFEIKNFEIIKVLLKFAVDNYLILSKWRQRSTIE